MSRGPTRNTRSLGGVIEVRGILGAAVADLGLRIVRGDWAPGQALPKEADLVDTMRVSRSVVREAFRILGAKGLIRSRTSDGTRITQRTEWRLLDPDVMDWRIKAGDTESLLRDLLRVRLVLEPGVAFTATAMADDTARAAIHAAWQAKSAVIYAEGLNHAERRAQFIELDLDFHRAFLEAVGSELLEQLFSVIEAALEMLLDLQMKAAGYTTEMFGMDQSHALHQEVYDAFARGDAAGAQAAMRQLIERAIDDAHRGFELLAH